MGLFTRFVEVGRAVVVTYGPELNKPAIIVDIVDLNRVIIDGPTSDVKRQVITLKRLALTDFVMKNIKRGLSSAKLAEALKSEDVIAEWKQTPEAKRRAAFMAKRQLNDFERFQVNRARSWISKSLRSL